MDHAEALQHRGRGRQTDYVLGTVDHGWSGFDVVRFHAVEEMSSPFRYDIVVSRDAALGRAPLDPLIDTPATFRIASEGRWRPVHGILAEAEEIDRTRQQILYRFVLVPHLYRALYRRRCRNFIGRTVEQIVSAVLENRGPAFTSGAAGLLPHSSEVEPPEVEPDFGTFAPPRGLYRWAVLDGGRIRNATIRPYVVQYNESDLDFVSRLLEEEGIAFFFEHARDACVLTLTDRPGKSPLFARDSNLRMHGGGHGGASRDQEVIRTFKDARRMRSRSVTARDFSWKRSRTLLEARVSTADGAAESSGHFEYPTRDEEVEKEPCMAPARFRMQRFEAERNFTSGSGTVRTMEPGHRFSLHDVGGLRDDGDYLIVRVETFAAPRSLKDTALDREPFGFPGSKPGGTGHESEFLVLPAAIDYRPAIVTPKPRIDGIQTALVTAEELPSPAEINCDKQGRVRLRFPWDQRDPESQAASSDWVRVSQAWAGGAYGAVHVPRVGHEVLVAYLQGDPDRPLVVGRVYNEQTPPPYDLAKDPTVSTVKSRSSPDSEGYNELRFEDRAKHEQVYLHAQRNLNEVVRADHTTSVGHDQKNTVKNDQTNEVKGDRAHTVIGIETLTIEGDRLAFFRSNEERWIDGFRITTILQDDTYSVHGKRDAQVGGCDILNVQQSKETTVNADESRYVTGNDQLGVGGDRSLVVSGRHHTIIGDDSLSRIYGHLLFDARTMELRVEGALGIASDTTKLIQRTSFAAEAPKILLDADGAKVEMSPGCVTLDNGAGAKIHLIAGMIFLNAPDGVYFTTGTLSVVADEMIVLGQRKISLNAGASIDGKAPKISWNG